MRIDPTQPIMFDSDSPPGRGTGYWQVGPDRGDDWDDDTSPRIDNRTTRILDRFLWTALFLGLPVAALDMMLR